MPHVASPVPPPFAAATYRSIALLAYYLRRLAGFLRHHRKAARFRSHVISHSFPMFEIALFCHTHYRYRRAFFTDMRDAVDTFANTGIASPLAMLASRSWRFILPPHRDIRAQWSSQMKWCLTTSRSLIFRDLGRDDTCLAAIPIFTWSNFELLSAISFPSWSLGQRFLFANKNIR